MFAHDSTQLSVSAAMRARDVSRPGRSQLVNALDLAESSPPATPRPVASCRAEVAPRQREAYPALEDPALDESAGTTPEAS